KIGLDAEALRGADVIIDALLGIGAAGAPRGAVREAITAINGAGKPVVSVDLPSGADCDTGAVAGVCVQAAVTVTFGLHKIGLVCYPAARYAGRVVVRGVSFAPGAVARQNIKARVIRGAELPVRESDSHKGSFGKVFAVCGSVGMTGAAYLSAQAALRTGCGLVTLGIPQSLNGIMARKLTEVMTFPLAERGGGLSADCIPAVTQAAQGADAIVCGCGLGRGGDVPAVVEAVLNTAQSPVVLDADGINALSAHTDMLKGNVCGVVITPHPGEMARLTGSSADEVRNNAVGVAKDFAAEYNVVTVLKGARTVVASPDGEIRINVNGNSGMATAGSGDVLAGMICSLIAQGQPPALAAANGVYLHGAAGDLAARRFGERGMLAGDLLEQIPHALSAV
ncbi:MAG: NAD(P)H-hydrate dehydratase, partial [Clostridiales bacterium]|nr:NAD(P)H-hydrate dehydratase [Clostridiales bacterium]